MIHDSIKGQYLIGGNGVPKHKEMMGITDMRIKGQRLIITFKSTKLAYTFMSSLEYEIDPNEDLERDVSNT